MRLGPHDRARAARLRAFLVASGRGVRSPTRIQEVGDRAATDSTERVNPDKPGDTPSRWVLVGKVLMAIAGVGLTLAGLILTYGDSRLQMRGRGRPAEFRGFKSAGTSLTFLCVLHYSFANSGLRSDYIDRVDIHPANLDDALRSDSKFVDRTRIAWRDTRELRFEILVTTSLTTYNWRNFLVTFYDSKGRQVAQTAFSTRFLKPGDLEPKVRHMRTLTDGVSDAAPPPRSLRTLVAASLSTSLPERYRDPQRRLFAKIVSASGQIVATTDASGEPEKGGRFDAKLKVISPIDKLDPLGYMIYITPPHDSSRRQMSGARIVVNWTRTWSDGTTDVQATEFTPERHEPVNTPAPNDR
jgi:hypothetical protein